MPNRTPAVSNARLVLAAATLLLSSATAWATSAPLPPTDPRAQDRAITAAPIPEPNQTPAERAIALWRHARGLDRSNLALTRPAALPARAQGGGNPPDGNPDDVHWQAGFGLPVPDGIVSTLLPLGSLLIAGGYFDRIGDLDAPGIAAWDGTGWSTLGDFPCEYVLDLAPYSGGLLALTSAPTVFRWDGAQWSALPPFPTESDAPAYYSLAMAVNDGQVAASIWTWTAGIGYRSRVFLFDGSEWHALGGHFDDAVDALAWYDGSLYAAGAFDSLDTTALPTIARWDGSAWRPVAAGLSGATYDQVRALAVFGGELVAAGSFRASPAAEVRHYASWNGTRWASLGTGGPAANSSALRLRVIGSELYGLGLFQSDHLYGIARWDGTAWHTGEDHLRFITFDVAPYQGELYAAGALTTDGSEAAPRLVRQRGGRWEAPLTPGEGMQGLLGWDGPGVRTIEAVDGGIVAGGRLDLAGGPGRWVHGFGTARWDGTRWSAFGDPYWDDIELSDLAWHQGTLYAAGYFRSDHGEFGSVAQFVGGRWALMSPSFQPFMNATCLVSAFGKLFLAGGISVGETGGIASWDGTAWQVVGGGITRGNYIAVMTTHGDELIAAGDFSEMGGVPCRNVAAWNPRSGWHALGDGLSGSVSDLISKDGALYAGTFDCYGQGIARWKNGRWETLSSARAWALAWYQGRLIASGDGFPGGIAYLDGGGTWRPMGSGLNGIALSFVERDASLFIGGYFSSAGGKAAYGFAEWRGALPRDDGPPPPDPSPTPTTQRMVAEPNPSAVAVHLRYDQPVSAHARVEIYDLTGHLVDTPFDGMQSAGPQDVVWEPDAGRVGAGVYFARVTTAGKRHVVRVVRVR